MYKTKFLGGGVSLFPPLYKRPDHHIQKLLEETKYPKHSETERKIIEIIGKMNSTPTNPAVIYSDLKSALYLNNESNIISRILLILSSKLVKSKLQPENEQKIKTVIITQIKDQTVSNDMKLLKSLIFLKKISGNVIIIIKLVLEEFEKKFGELNFVLKFTCCLLNHLTLY